MAIDLKQVAKNVGKEAFSAAFPNLAGAADRFTRVTASAFVTPGRNKNSDGTPVKSGDGEQTDGGATLVAIRDSLDKMTGSLNRIAESAGTIEDAVGLQLVYTKMIHSVLEKKLGAGPSFAETLKDMLGGEGVRRGGAKATEGLLKGGGGILGGAGQAAGRLGSVGGVVGRAAPVLGGTFEAFLDYQRYGDAKRAGGTFAGGTMGALGGATLGGIAGSAFGPVGTIIGALGGGYLGSSIGGKAGGDAVDWLSGTDRSREPESEPHAERLPTEQSGLTGKTMSFTAREVTFRADTLRFDVRETKGLPGGGGQSTVINNYGQATGQGDSPVLGGPNPGQRGASGSWGSQTSEGGASGGGSGTKAGRRGGGSSGSWGKAEGQPERADPWIKSGERPVQAEASIRAMGGETPGFTMPGGPTQSPVPGASSVTGPLGGDSGGSNYHGMGYQGSGPMAGKEGSPTASGPITGTNNPRLAADRAKYMKELEDPVFREKVMKTLSLENGKSGKAMTAVLEAAMNRASMNGVSLKKSFNFENPRKSFFGPVRRGEIDRPLSEVHRKRGEEAIAAAGAGSNMIQHRTDQGMWTDPSARDFYSKMPDKSGHIKVEGENYFYMHAPGRRYAANQERLDREYAEKQRQQGQTPAEPSSPQQPQPTETPSGAPKMLTLQGYKAQKEAPAEVAPSKDLVLQPQIGDPGKTRDKPISKNLHGVFSAAAHEQGLQVVVTSGGQEGSRRTGSTRHDHGNAGDIQLKDAKTGRILNMNNPEDQARMAKFAETSAKMGATGIGAGPGYMGAHTMHVGYGAPGVWGAKGRGVNAPQWLRDAHSRGMADPYSPQERQRRIGEAYAAQRKSKEQPSQQPQQKSLWDNVPLPPSAVTPAQKAEAKSGVTPEKPKESAASRLVGESAKADDYRPRPVPDGMVDSTSPWSLLRRPPKDATIQDSPTPVPLNPVDQTPPASRIEERSGRVNDLSEVSSPRPETPVSDAPRSIERSSEGSNPMTPAEKTPESRSEIDKIQSQPVENRRSPDVIDSFVGSSGPGF